MPRVSSNSIFVNFASDATKHQIAAMEKERPSNQIIERSEDNELKALLLSLKLAHQKAKEIVPLFSAHCYVDNKAVIAARAPFPVHGYEQLFYETDFPCSRWQVKVTQLMYFSYYIYACNFMIYFHSFFSKN